MVKSSVFSAVLKQIENEYIEYNVLRNDKHGTINIPTCNTYAFSSNIGLSDTSCYTLSQ